MSEMISSRDEKIQDLKVSFETEKEEMKRDFEMKMQSNNDENEKCLMRIRF